MADRDPPEYFADLVSHVSHANGVFRITFAQQGVEGATTPVTKMLIPANQLQNMMTSIAGAANEIREKVQAQSDDDAVEADETMGEPAAKPKSKKKK